MRALTIAAIIAGLSASLASAQVPAGGEFQVNTYTTGWQAHRSLASDAAGNSIVTWCGGDGSQGGIFAQRLDAAGVRRGDEFQVNTYTTSDQCIWPGGATVTSDSAGNFVVVWQSPRFDPWDMWDVFAQRFDAAGGRLGAEFRVNSYTSGWQWRPVAASDAGGNFVVVWQGAGEDSLEGISAQRFAADGSRRGGEFRVNTYTTGPPGFPSVASDAAGNFVVAWSGVGISARLVDANGTPRGSQFRVDTHTTIDWPPSVASDAAGNFVVAWASQNLDGDSMGVFARRFDATGAPWGGEFQVNSYTTSYQGAASVASDASGNFVVAWWSDIGPDGESGGGFAQRFDASGARRGTEFRVNAHTTDGAGGGPVASDAVGNFVVSWTGQDQDDWGVFAQRFGGLQPAALSVDPSALVLADGNGVFEPGESVRVAPSWKNINGQTLSFDGGLLSFTGPTGPGVSYSVQQAIARYGTVANGDTVTCTDCFQVGVDLAGPRPTTHWDATLTERISPDALGQTKPWALHVGQSFSDAPKTSPFYPFVERILHRGVTGGCSATTYCPASPVTREQVAVFTLAGKEGALYSPQACSSPPFSDVPTSSPFCRHIAELARRGVVSGCGNGNYCPSDPVTREQMPIFVLRVLDPALVPPPCGTPVFNDVPASSPYCAWIEEVARRGVVSGCGSGNYCPTDPVTREQMAVFVAVAFGLGLYGL